MGEVNSIGLNVNKDGKNINTSTTSLPSANGKSRELNINININSGDEKSKKGKKPSISIKEGESADENKAENTDIQTNTNSSLTQPKENKNLSPLEKMMEAAKRTGENQSNENGENRFKETPQVLKGEDISNPNETEKKITIETNGKTNDDTTDDTTDECKEETPTTVRKELKDINGNKVLIKIKKNPETNSPNAKDYEIKKKGIKKFIRKNDINNYLNPKQNYLKQNMNNILLRQQAMIKGRLGNEKSSNMQNNFMPMLQNPFMNPYLNPYLAMNPNEMMKFQNMNQVAMDENNNNGSFIEEKVQ